MSNMQSMNTSIRRYAAELAAAPELHRALGLLRSCRELVARIGIDGPLGDVHDGLDELILGLTRDIEIAATEATADANDAAGDHRRDQDQPTDAEIDRAQERMEHLFGRDALMETENA